MISLLHSLIFDNSSTVCTIALAVLSKLLPIFAVKASDHLKSLLPLLLVVLARILCWKERPPSSPRFPAFPEREDTDVEDAAAAALCDVAHGHEGRAIEVAGELGMFYESVFLQESLEPIMRNEVIVFAVFLAHTWRPSCV